MPGCGSCKGHGICGYEFKRAKIKSQGAQQIYNDRKNCTAWVHKDSLKPWKNPTPDQFCKLEELKLKGKLTINGGSWE